MHRSRLAGLIIDCETTDLGGAATFWGAALGRRPRALPGAEGERYVELVDPTGALHVEVQAVSHPSRVHLDIESDDVEAEVLRLLALGARRVRAVGDWWVLEAPTGQRFCVVPASSPRFAAEASVWP